MSGKDVQLTSDAARLLGDTLIRKRVELGYRSARKLGLVSQLDYRTITSLESGRRTSVSRSTLAVLEIALAYPQGFLTALVHDGAVPEVNTVVELTVPGNVPKDVVNRARVAAQATFNAVVTAMQHDGMNDVSHPSGGPS